jgi:DNA-binding XRE family transcriptional regulator
MQCVGWAKHLKKYPSGDISRAWDRLSMSNDLLADLSEALVDYRKKHGLTQYQMAEKIGISRSGLQLIEYGLTNIYFVLTNGLSL